MTAVFLASVLALTNQFGSVRFDTFGARVLSYVPAGGREVFAQLPSGAGGVPICWPWFQYNGPNGSDSPKHGLARNREFELRLQESATNASRAVLQLVSDAKTRCLWPYDFSLTVTICLDEKGLMLDMTGTNTGTRPFAVTEAFHPYMLRIEVDQLQDDGTGDFRVWNPDETSHLKTEGLGIDDWRKFLCVENGIFRRESAHVLKPGESHSLRRRFFPTPEARTASLLQSRIDAVSAAGGGSVRVAGEWTVASLTLKDGVTLHLKENARLLASTNVAEYANTPGENRGAVVCANNATGVAIEGRGVVDGRGGIVPRAGKAPGRWRGVVFTRCRDVRIEDVTIRDAHSWGCFVKECENVVVRHVTISNHANLNNDGLDIASKDVLVEDCDIDSEDDGIVLKNFNPDFVVENVCVRNCRVSSNSSFVKIGTETYGGFRNVDIRDCELDVRTPISIRTNYLNTPGVTTLFTGGDGISIQAVDGGFVDGVTVSGIRMKRGICVPVCIRLDRRHSRPGGQASYLRNVTVENVTMEEPSTSWLPCVVTGGSGLRPSDITFRNCYFRMKGGADDALAAFCVPEKDGGYPGGRQFGVVTPAYGLYVRHANGVSLDDVRFEAMADDPRQGIWHEDTDGFSILCVK